MMAFPSLPQPWSAAAIAAPLSFVLCPLLIQLAPRLRLMDEPDEGRKKHGRPVPLVGGIAVALAVIAALSGQENSETLVLALAILGLGAVGLLDDLVGLEAGPKLGLQLVVPSMVVGISWYAVGYFNPGSEGQPWFWFLLLAAWLFPAVLLTNALNFTDNSNGLCSGLAVILLVAEGYAMGKWAAVLAFSFAAGFLGFLPWNYPAARAFLGDCGSHLAGAAVGVCAAIVLLVNPVPLAPRFLGVGLILAIPLLDMAVAVGGRLRRGQAPWKGDLTHLSHRLIARGLKPAAAVAILWLAALVTSVAGILVLTWR